MGLDGSVICVQFQDVKYLAVIRRAAVDSVDDGKGEFALLKVVTVAFGCIHLQ